jgi:hypothetical protein
VPGVGTFGSRLVFDLDETRPPAGSREDAVFVQALASVAGALGKRPLLRAGCVEQRVAQAGDVEVAPARAFTMFDENCLGVGVGKQLRGQRLFEAGTQTAREIDGDLPVVACLAGRGDRRGQVG